MQMTHMSSMRGARAVVVGLLVALLVLMIEHGVWSLVGAAVIPHFAPELGPLAGFIVFSLVDAAYFVPPFLVVACSFLWLVRGTPRAGRWVVIPATLLVAGTVSIISAAWLNDRREDTEFIVALSVLPAGVGAGVVLRGWNESAAPEDERARVQ